MKKLIWLILFIAISITIVGCNTLPVEKEEATYIVPSLVPPTSPILETIPTGGLDSEVLAVVNKNSIKLIFYIDKLEGFISDQADYYKEVITQIVK
jgi:hypothetical protein